MLRANILPPQSKGLPEIFQELFSHALAVIEKLKVNLGGYSDLYLNKASKISYHTFPFMNLTFMMIIILLVNMLGKGNLNFYKANPWNRQHCDLHLFQYIPL